MAPLPFALVGGFWLLWLLGYHMSIAAAVGFIALGGVAAEIGVVMLLYVNQAVATQTSDLRDAIVDWAALRVRPIAMTVAGIIARLPPILLVTGTCSQEKERITASI